MTRLDYWAAVGDEYKLYWDRDWYREKLAHDVRCAYRDACDRIAKAAA